MDDVKKKPGPKRVRVKSIQVSVNKEQLTAICELSERQQRSWSWIVAMLIDEALAARHEPRQAA